MKKIFLFVNPTSGGNKASIFIRFGINEIIFHKPYKCHFYIYSMLEGEHKKKPGFIKLSSVINEQSSENINDNASDNSDSSHKKNTTISSEEKQSEEHKNFSVYILVAGGDGTLNWVIQEVDNYNINYNKFAIGLIPFGTANDFSKTFGWKRINGVLNETVLFQILKRIVNQVFRAHIKRHDYWNVEFVLSKEGYFNKINSKTKKKEVLKENDEIIKKIQKCMSNYFSIGIDSRIGRGFEKRRKKNEFCNKFIYLLEGCKKVSFKKNTPINALLDKMVMDNNDNDVIFTTNKTDNNFPLLKKSKTIVCINIPYYACGNDIWGYTHKLGLKLPKTLDSDKKKDYENLKKSKQEVGDGMLEFVIFPKGTDLGLEYTLKGRARRVHQGTGPWKMFFKENVDSVYFQVDGEYYFMSLPEYVAIEHNKKINVLHNIL
ncbi:diacylglycerol kinase, putative [Hepatocystis sp. ex Piliocolobus tephrosceles]|nr:diacylglycerol kinase, putative [Hepatocystis sp. ex Piliocolobus tephrosceles]